MSLLDDYKKQVNSYDAGKPNTPVQSRGKAGTVIAKEVSPSRPYAPEPRAQVQPPAPAPTPAPTAGQFEHRGFFGGGQPIPGAEWGWKGGDPHRADWGSTPPNWMLRGQPGPLPQPAQASGAVRGGEFSDVFSGKGPSTFRSAVDTVFGPGSQRVPTSASQQAGSDPARLAFDQSGLRGSVARPSPGTHLLSQDATGKAGWFGADGRPTQPNFGSTGLPAGSSLLSNYTPRFQAADDLFRAQIAAIERGEPIGPMYTPQGQPGGGTYQKDSMMDQLTARRELLAKRLDATEASSSGFSDIFERQFRTKGLRDEIKNIDAQIFGRADLANKIQLAILQNLGAQGVQGMRETGEDRRATAGNESLFNVHSMREQMETGRSIMGQLSAERIAAGKLSADDAAARQKANEKSVDFVNGINRDAIMKIVESSIPKEGGAVDPNTIAELTRKTYSAFYPDNEKGNKLLKDNL